MSEFIAYSLIAMTAWFGLNEVLGTGGSGGRRGGRGRVGGRSRSRGRSQYNSRRDYDDY